MRSIMDDLQIQTIGFLKVDIEGGEYDVFQSPDWLELVENIALEVHPPADKKAALFASLERAGFKAYCVDWRRNPIAPEYAEYIFASRNAHAFADPVR